MVCWLLGVFWVGEYGSGMSISSFPLAGRTVAVTASRRVREQVAAFERQGARVLVTPTVRIVPVALERFRLGALVKEVTAVLAAGEFIGGKGV